MIQGELSQEKQSFLIEFLRKDTEEQQLDHLRNYSFWEQNHPLLKSSEWNQMFRKFQCLQCKNLFKKPSGIECEHYFCETCINAIPFVNNMPYKKCPICESYFTTPEPKYQCQKLQIALNAQHFPCFVCKQWRGTLFNLAKHLQIHYFFKNTCSKCNEKYLLLYKKEHDEYDCRNRLVQCPNCQLQIIYNNFELHLDQNCKYSTTFCETCQIVFGRDDNAQHICRQVKDLKNCNRYDFGCRQQFQTLQALIDHMGIDCPYQFIRCMKCQRFFMKQDLAQHQCDQFNMSTFIEQVKKPSENAVKNKIELVIQFEVIEESAKVNELIDFIQTTFGGIHNHDIKASQKSSSYIIFECDSSSTSKNCFEALRNKIFYGKQLKMRILSID